MLPGVLSRQYQQDQMEIDLVRLCNSVGSRLIPQAPVQVDVKERQLLFSDRPPLKYDLLSIGIGSEPVIEGIEVGDGANLVRIKPMQTLLQLSLIHI